MTWCSWLARVTRDYQEIDGVRHPFSDIEQAERALAAWEVPHA